MTMTTSFIGVDVGKAQLDVYLAARERCESLENNAKGHRRLAAWLKREACPHVVMEATGGYERALHRHLVKNNIPASIVNPAEARQFARAMGLHAKTDAIDARMLAHFAQVRKPAPTPAPSAERDKIMEMLSYRRQLVGERTRLINQAQHYCQPRVKRHARRRLKTIRADIKALETELVGLATVCPEIAPIYAIITSVPGVGPVSALTLIASLPELGQLTRRQIASLLGVAPFARDSGKMRGSRSIAGGRGEVRKILYMATLAGLRHNPVLRRKRDQLRAAGKAPKVAIIACLRKLIVTLNAMVRDGTPWQMRDYLS